MDGVVFISYSRVDKDRITRLAKYLLKNEIPIWWDEKIQAGQKYSFLIGSIIEKAACIIVAWSAASVKSKWVLAEAEKGSKTGLVIPITLDKNIDIPLPFNIDDTYNLTTRNFLIGSETKALLKTIQSILKNGRPVNPYEETLINNTWSINNAVQATDKVRDLVAKLGSLREVMGLKGKPVADIQLALKEVEKTYKVVSGSIRKFLAPLANTGTINFKPYLEMERGSLLSMIQKGHGHCTLILTHYAKTQGLREWVAPKLNSKQLKELDNIFAMLGTADGDLFKEMSEIGKTLTNESRVILNLLISGQQKMAQKRLIEGRDALQPLENKLSSAYIELQKMQQLIGSPG